MAAATAGDAAEAQAAGSTASSTGSAGVSVLHVPVLLERCMELLAPALRAAPGGRRVMVDCTLGTGGHTEAALTRFGGLSVIGIDRDPQALAVAGARLARFGERFRAVHAVYDQVGALVREHARDMGAAPGGGVDAVLMDLGVSSLQLDHAARGFSYARAAQLDMRMDQTTGRTARDLLETADVAEITRILRTYGEERFAHRIARAVVGRREAGHPVATSEELADLVQQSVPAWSRRGGHPARRTFQALRIAVNAELEVLERALPQALNCLRVGGRVVVESYHSLEDRLVKQLLASGAASRAPRGLPVVPEGDQPYLRLLTRGALQADPHEVAANPRSASVRLRAAERTRSAHEAPAPLPDRRHRPPGGPEPAADRLSGRQPPDNQRATRSRRSRQGEAHR